MIATAGWDARIRVYSAKTIKELAVLKWHKGGCYATAFAAIGDENNDGDTASLSENQDPSSAEDLIQHSSTVSTVQQRRDAKARSTHWLAAGSKDGKVSLWDIY